MTQGETSCRVDPHALIIGAAVPNGVRHVLRGGLKLCSLCPLGPIETSCYAAHSPDPTTETVQDRCQARTRHLKRVVTFHLRSSRATHARSGGDLSESA